jgi:hypothetical protein
MTHRLGHLGFNSALGVSLDYLIHNSSGWGHVSGVHSPGVGPKGLALVRLHVIQNKKKIAFCKVIHLHISQSK